MDGEDRGASDGEPGEDWGDDGEGDRLRGWIPPDDRLWRHPSEIGGPSTVTPSITRTESRSRPGPWLVGGATACVVFALVAAGLVMTTMSSGDEGAAGTPSLVGSPTTEPGLVRVTSSATITGMVASIRQSTVALSVERGGRTATSIGLVAESGGIIVATSAAVSGARSITVIEPGGTRRAATLIGADPASGLVVLQISDDLPAATFDGGDLPAGSVAFALSLAPGRQTGSAPTPEVYAGTVVSVGEPATTDQAATEPVTADQAATFAATEVRTPLTAGDIGCPLLDSSGQVEGMLAETAGSGSSTLSMFLPAELVLGVARQLVSAGTVEHGWLGVDSGGTQPTSTVGTGTTPSTAVGARVGSVDSGSPAAVDELAPGDVITALDGDRVQSDAELRTRLYADPPGTAVQITFERGYTTMTRTAVLADPAADDPGADPSP